MQCPHCGSPLNADDAVCPVCGKPVQESQSTHTEHRIQPVAFEATTTAVMQPIRMQESQQRPLMTNMNSPALPPSLPPAESARRRGPARTATAAAGEPVNDPAVPRTGQAHASTATRNGRHVWIIVAIVLIVAILAGIGVWAWRTQPRPHPDASAQQPTSEVQPTPSESMDGGETGGAADEERPRESAAEQQAHDELQRQVEADKAKAAGLLNVYTTQLSSKKPGLQAAGRTWTYETILGQYRELKAKYPNALLVWGPDYTNYSRSGHPSDYYVMLSGETFATAQAAKGWCTANGYGSEDCLPVHLAQ